MTMFVIKRGGKRETVNIEKITKRISKLCHGLDPKYVEPATIAQKVIQGAYPGVTTVELDELAAQTAASFATYHPDCSTLAARISVSKLHKSTQSSYIQTTNLLYNYYHPKTGKHAPLISYELYQIVQDHGNEIDKAIVHERDYDFDYFGFKTLEKSYLLKHHHQEQQDAGDDDDAATTTATATTTSIIERPQHMYMRVAIAIHSNNIPRVIETYNLLSQQFYIHTTPTLFNAGTPNSQMSSCFLMCMKDNSIHGIYDTLKHCAIISKYAGGIGLSISNMPATTLSGDNVERSMDHDHDPNDDSHVEDDNGIVPMLRVYNDTVRHVDQGGRKRKGGIAIYIEPWHADIFSFLNLKKNHGNESQRARDLFYALWIPDLFMIRVQNDDDWTLFCPEEYPNLSHCYGDDFRTLYESYERQKKKNNHHCRRTISARMLWFAILDAQVETGTPYMLYKDHCNAKSNQKNLGTIQGSNLCSEIIEYTSPQECAVCNLASLNLTKFIKSIPTSYNDVDNDDDDNFDMMDKFDFDSLMNVTKVVTKNLNRIIDCNFYPIEEAKRSNMRHRPIAVGVQGLADVFQLLKIPFDSPMARNLNRTIFETIYFGACTASCELSQYDGGPYPSYEGSPASQGLLQFDLWNVKPNGNSSSSNNRCCCWDWDDLKENIAKHGLKNSLLVAPMPTASTAQILGNNESIEPFTSNMYNRRVLAGEFSVVNKHMLRDLTSLDLWNASIRNRIIANRGSIQQIMEIPSKIRNVYRTVWEIPQKSILEMAADRGPFIDQSQSLNIHMAEPTSSKLTSMHFFAWKLGLKTGMYYLRTRPKADAIQFTVNQEELRSQEETKKIIDTAKIISTPIDEQSAVRYTEKDHSIIFTMTNGGNDNDDDDHRAFYKNVNSNDKKADNGGQNKNNIEFKRTKRRRQQRSIQWMTSSLSGSTSSLSRSTSTSSRSRSVSPLSRSTSPSFRKRWVGIVARYRRQSATVDLSKE